MQSVIRIGSRESKLAVIQAKLIKDTIQKHYPDLKIELVTMKTTGDKILDKSLELIGGKGLFVKELDQALIEKRIDISVHSLKDMPMEVSDELPILAYSKREDPRDVLLYREKEIGIPHGGIIGTSSRRRSIQLARLYPGCECRGIRGNVQTRLRKLEEDGYDGTVLAAAGLRRLHMENLMGHIFSIEEMIPAAGQGILAIQGRAGEDHSYLNCIHDLESETAAIAERAFVSTLGGGCTAPIAAYAKVEAQEVQLTGLYYCEEEDKYWVEKKNAPRSKAKQLGIALAETMKERYGR